jgi:hypothetical protein
VKLHGSDAFKIEYKRFKECLLNVPGGEKKSLHHLKGVVSCLDSKLDTTMCMNGNLVQHSI